MAERGGEGQDNLIYAITAAAPPPVTSPSVPTSAALARRRWDVARNVQWPGCRRMAAACVESAIEREQPGRQRGLRVLRT